MEHFIILSAYLSAEHLLNHYRHSLLVNAAVQSGIPFRLSRGQWNGEPEQGIILELKDIDSFKAHAFARTMCGTFGQECYLYVSPEKRTYKVSDQDGYWSSDFMGIWYAYTDPACPARVRQSSDYTADMGTTQLYGIYTTEMELADSMTAAAKVLKEQPVDRAPVFGTSEWYARATAGRRNQYHK